MIPFNRLMALPLLILAMAAAAPLPPLPTIADARQHFADAKYKDVVRDVSKIIASREWQAKKPDAYELYSMKAEAHFKLKEVALAASSFEAAAKASTDPVAIAQARTTVYLIKHSIGTNFVPRATKNERGAGGKTDDHPKVDILEPDSRKTAFTAVWEDEKKATADSFTAATDTDNKSIKAVLEATPMIAQLRQFDMAANGNDNETKKTSAVMAEHARDLLTEMIDKMAIHVDVVSGKALAVERYKVNVTNGYGVDRWRKHGMEDKEPTEMAEALANADQFPKVVKTLSEGLFTEKDFFDHILKEAKHIHDRADKTLKADYTKSFSSKAAAEE